MFLFPQALCAPLAEAGLVACIGLEPESTFRSAFVDFFEHNMGFCLVIPHFRVEHPAGGYKKLFETVEELSSPLTAHVTGWSHQS